MLKRMALTKSKKFWHGQREQPGKCCLVSKKRVSRSVFSAGFCDGEFAREDGEDDGFFEVWASDFALFSHGFLRCADYLLCQALFGRNFRSITMWLDPRR